jgi:hypothetical protein
LKDKLFTVFFSYFVDETLLWEQFHPEMEARTDDFVE